MSDKIKYISTIRSICKEVSSNCLNNLPNFISEVFEETIVEITKYNLLRKFIKHDIVDVKYYYDSEAAESYGVGTIDIYLDNDKPIEISQEHPTEQIITYKNNVEYINIKKLEECLIWLDKNIPNGYIIDFDEEENQIEHNNQSKNNPIVKAYKEFKKCLMSHKRIINYYWI